MNHKPIYDEYDPWAMYNPGGTTFVRRTPKRVRNRRPTLASVIRQATKAGIEVARYEVDANNGKIIVVTGKSVALEMTNSTDANIETSADLRRLL
jgi:hypothetical protein